MSKKDENEEETKLVSLLFPKVLIDKIEIKEITPCIIDPDKVKFIAQADKPLGDILSTLYLYISNANYSENLGTVSYKHSQRIVTVFSTGKISMTYVKDKQEAEKLVVDLKRFLNRAIIYQGMYGKPDTKLVETKKKLNVMTIHQNLPKTDCKACGETGCYTFAVKLINGDVDLKSCKPLSEISNLKKATQLRNLLQPVMI